VNRFDTVLIPIIILWKCALRIRLRIKFVMLLQLPLNYIRSVLDRAFRIKIFDAKGIPNEYQRYLVFKCRICSSLLREK